MKLKPADWQPLPEVYRLEREREEIPERRRIIARQRMLAILERTGKRQSAPDAPAAVGPRPKETRADEVASGPAARAGGLGFDRRA
jgi:hypothetical protein